MFLTAAAVGFIAAALLREEGAPGTPSLEAAASITGANYAIDGGWTAQ